jgi:hypothetical protein
MRATLNRFLFTIRVFDSGALGALTSVIHQCTQAGLHTAMVRRNGRNIGSVSWEVSDGAPNMQLTIDLSRVQESPRQPEKCDCASEGNSPLTLHTRGYVLFHTSTGVGGYSVLAALTESPDRAFDSERLSEGDLFALSLLEPAAYSMENVIGTARGSLVVAFSAEHAPSIAAQPAQYIEVWGDRFEPNEVSLTSGQGLVFRAHDDARIVIRHERSHHDEEPRRRGAIRIERRTLLEPAGRAGERRPTN